MLICVLASLITCFITRKRTLTSIILIVVIHGMTRTKEFIEMLYKCGIYISYNKILLLQAIWTFGEAEFCKTCPCGIAYRKPPIVCLTMISKLIPSLVMQLVPLKRTCYTCNPNRLKDKVTMTQHQFIKLTELANVH